MWHQGQNTSKQKTIRSSVLLYNPSALPEKSLETEVLFGLVVSSFRSYEQNKKQVAFEESRNHDAYSVSNEV